MKIYFGICLCSMIMSLSKVSNLIQNGHFPTLSLFWQPFFAIETVRVNFIPGYYTWVKVLKNILNKLIKSGYCVWLNSPLMQVAL